jgi:hypothetical protein
VESSKDTAIGKAPQPKDFLGNRIKEECEKRVRILPPRLTYTIIFLTVKAFRSCALGFQRTFDQGPMDDIDDTSKFLCENIQG